MQQNTLAGQVLRGLLLLSLGGCVESYMPDVVSAPNSYLVVDGFINGNGRTRITLTRSLNVATTTAPPAEKGAQLAVVDNTGQRYPLTEQRSGYYVSDSLRLPAGRSYKLRISLGSGASGATYESDFAPMKVTPEFDRLEPVRQNGQVQLLLSTHDPAGQSRFYRWGFAETWEFHSAYESELEYRGGIVQSRITPIYTCWRTQRPSTILQRSSASLSQDAIVDYQLTSFSDRDERLKIRYSIVATQYVQTPDEFAYYEILRKNTEAVGTVNDPLPSQLTGNMHRLDDATEPVLGFVSAHTLVVRRLFVTAQSLGLPANWSFDDPYATCAEVQEPVPDPRDKFPNILHIPQTRVFAIPDYVPTHYSIGSNGPDGYYGSTRECVDCRTRGSNVKPSFW